MKELFKTVHGSRLYGTNTPTSDTDYKVVYLPPLSDVLLGKRFSNFKETSNAGHERNGPEDVETEFIALQTFARDFFDGQTYALEIAFAKDRNFNKTSIFDAMHFRFSAFVHDLIERFLTRDVSKMIGYAYHQASVYSVKGARLDTLEKLYHHAYDVLTSQPLGDTVARRTVIDVLIPWVEANTDQYMFMTTVENARGGMESAPAISILGKLITASTPLEHGVGMLKNMFDKYGHRAKQAQADAGHDWKAIGHALRVTYQAQELLSTGKMTLPLAPKMVEELLLIRNGSLPWETVEPRFKQLLDQVDLAKETSTLPERNESLEKEFEKFLVNKLLDFYQLPHLGS